MLFGLVLVSMLWFVPGGESFYYTKTEAYLRRHWTVRIEDIKEKTGYLEDVANFYRTRRFCVRATPFVDIFKALVHDSQYPYRREADPGKDVPDLVIWGYFLREFIFYNERETGNDSVYAQILAQYEINPAYKTFLHIFPIWVFGTPLFFFFMCFFLPTIVKPLFHIGWVAYHSFFHRRHRRFWRALFLNIEIGFRRGKRYADPFSVDFHSYDYEYVLPKLFREPEGDYSEPDEVFYFQPVVTVWIEDDSDSEVDKRKMYDLLYDKKGEPYMNKINMNRGVRINLRKQSEYRSEDWYTMANLRLKALERRKIQQYVSAFLPKPDIIPTWKRSHFRRDSTEGQMYDQLVKEDNAKMSGFILLRRLSSLGMETP